MSHTQERREGGGELREEGSKRRRMEGGREGEKEGGRGEGGRGLLYLYDTICTGRKVEFPVYPIAGNLVSPIDFR